MDIIYMDVYIYIWMCKIMDVTPWTTNPILSPGVYGFKTY